LADAVRITRAVADALGYAQQQGWSHSRTVASSKFGKRTLQGPAHLRPAVPRREEHAAVPLT
jgi:hypothetical protein